MPSKAGDLGNPQAPPEAQASPFIRLKPRQEDRLMAGHAWVFSNEIAEISGSPAAGSVVEAFGAGGQRLGVGFYNPSSLIAWRRLSAETVAIDAAFFKQRLGEALRRRASYCPGENSFRLCFGESDGLPGLVVDKYEDVLVLQILSAGMEASIHFIEEALQGLLSPRGIFLDNEHRARALEGLKGESRVLCGGVPDALEISEGGLKFKAAIAAGQKTGFYFDQRENRAFLAPYFKGRVVLDLYCYTGAFALNAARAQAASVYALDSSAKAVALARENAALNGLESVRFDEGDAEEALAAFAAGPRDVKPDMILLDPPSLVPSRKHLPKAMRHYVKLNAQALRALPSGGLLATSTCSHHVSRELFVEMLRQAQAKARRPARLAALRGQAADHPILLAMPETEYLHFALLEVL